MGRLTVTLDEELLEDARQALGTKTKRETIVVALREASRRACLRRILEHRGRIELGIGQDELLQRRTQS